VGTAFPPLQLRSPDEVPNPANHHHGESGRIFRNEHRALSIPFPRPQASFDSTVSPIVEGFPITASFLFISTSDRQYSYRPRATLILSLRNTVILSRYLPRHGRSRTRLPPSVGDCHGSPDPANISIGHVAVGSAPVGPPIPYWRLAQKQPPRFARYGHGTCRVPGRLDSCSAICSQKHARS
jgi:hypothetical protein